MPDVPQIAKDEFRVDLFVFQSISSFDLLTICSGCIQAQSLLKVTLPLARHNTLFLCTAGKKMNKDTPLGG